MKARQLRALANQFRRLADNGLQHPRPEKQMLIQSEAAGRLIAEAMDVGAWPWSDDLRDLREQTIDGREMGYAGLWIMVRQHWLSVVSPHHDPRDNSNSLPWSYVFPNDCRAIAASLEDEASGKGEPPKRVSRRSLKLGAKVLTPRQTQATELYGVHNGNVSKVARAMGVSIPTARQHVQAGWRKLPADCRPNKTAKTTPRITALPTDRRGQPTV